MAFTTFTREYVDRSNSTGFQFEFFCDVCAASHMTEFRYDPMGVASCLINAMGGLLRGGYQAGRASEELNRLLRGKAWDEAYAAAVDEAKRHFKRCDRCNKWVCPKTCWNDKSGLCRRCAPILAAEAKAMKAHAGKFQLFGKAVSTDQTNDWDISKEEFITCPHCNAQNQGGSFCADCGMRLIVEMKCPDCGANYTAAQKYQYCPSCGTNMSGASKSTASAKAEEPAASAKAKSSKKPKAANTKPKSGVRKATASKAKTKPSAKSAAKPSGQKPAAKGKTSASPVARAKPKSKGKKAR